MGPCLRPYTQDPKTLTLMGKTLGSSGPYPVFCHHTSGWCPGGTNPRGEMVLQDIQSSLVGYMTRQIKLHVILNHVGPVVAVGMAVPFVCIGV